LPLVSALILTDDGELADAGDDVNIAIAGARFPNMSSLLPILDERIGRLNFQGI